MRCIWRRGDQVENNEQNNEGKNNTASSWETDGVRSDLEKCSPFTI